MSLECIQHQVNLSARVQLLIRKVWVAGFTWNKIENYFGLNRNTLLDELKEGLKNSGDYAQAVKAFCDKIADNEKANAIEICR